MDLTYGTPVGGFQDNASTFFAPVLSALHDLERFLASSSLGPQIALIVLEPVRVAVQRADAEFQHLAPSRRQQELNVAVGECSRLQAGLAHMRGIVSLQAIEVGKTQLQLAKNFQQLDALKIELQDKIDELKSLHRVEHHGHSDSVVRYEFSCMNFRDICTC